MRFRYGRRGPRLKERPKLPPGLWLPRRGSRRRVDHLVYSVPPFFAPRGGGRICRLGKSCRAAEGAESGGKGRFAFTMSAQRPHNVRARTTQFFRRPILSAAVRRLALHFFSDFFRPFFAFPALHRPFADCFFAPSSLRILKVCGDFFERIACGVFRFVKGFWG